jgi:hypothetical protein
MATKSAPSKTYIPATPKKVNRRKNAEYTMFLFVTTKNADRTVIAANK